MVFKRVIVRVSVRTWGKMEECGEVIKSLTEVQCVTFLQEEKDVGEDEEEEEEQGHNPDLTANVPTNTGTPRYSPSPKPALWSKNVSLSLVVTSRFIIFLLYSFDEQINEQLLWVYH